MGQKRDICSVCWVTASAAINYIKDEPELAAPAAFCKLMSLRELSAVVFKYYLPMSRRKELPEADLASCPCPLYCGDYGEVFLTSLLGIYSSLRRATVLSSWGQGLSSLFSLLDSAHNGTSQLFLHQYILLVSANLNQPGRFSKFAVRFVYEQMLFLTMPYQPIDAPLEVQACLFIFPWMEIRYNLEIPQVYFFHF